MIFFDLDGVLTDTRELHRAAFRRAMEEVASIRLTFEQESSLEGLPTRDKLRRLGILADSYNFTAITDRKQQLTEFALENLKPDPRIGNLIFSLWTQHRLALFTNSIAKTTHTVLQKIGLFRYFDAVITNESVSKPKPDPEGYLTFGADAVDLIVEDSEHGYAAATAAVGPDRVLRVAGPHELTLGAVEAALKRARR